MLQRMVNEPGEAGLRSRAEAARVIGLVPDVFDRELRKLLEDDAPEVAREAVRAAGLLAKRPLAHRLIDRIAEPWLTDDIVDALARMGDRVVGTIRDQMVDRDTPAATRRELPAVLQAIGSPAAQHVLVESMLDADTVLRTRVLTALNKLVQLHPGRRLDQQIEVEQGLRRTGEGLQPHLVEALEDLGLVAVGRAMPDPVPHVSASCALRVRWVKNSSSTRSLIR